METDTIRKPNLRVVEGYEINELCDAVSEVFPASSPTRGLWMQFLRKCKINCLNKNHINNKYFFKKISIDNIYFIYLQSE